MPAGAIPGFVKKKTGSQRYRRSPRQLTRDITIALEMSDERVLPHLRIRTEDGELFDGNELTSHLIKTLREEGRNPMWYLRKTWLEEAFGKRGAEGTQNPDDEANQGGERKSDKDDEAHPTLVQMMQETIKELKGDKDHLIGQLKIKDDQISETTERWKESNILTQNLHKRIETIEQLMLDSGQTNRGTGDSQDHAEAQKPQEPQKVIENEEKKTVSKQKRISSNGAASTQSQPRRQSTSKRRAMPTKAKKTSKSKLRPNAGAPKPKVSSEQKTARKKKTPKKKTWYNTPITELFSRR